MAPAFLRNLVPVREDRASRVAAHDVQEAHVCAMGSLFSGWLAWTCDAIDFFSVSLSVTRLTEQFGKTTNDLTTSITLTLLFRSLGAVIFGIISDRYGRKWPLVCNLLLCCVLELGSAFVNTFRSSWPAALYSVSPWVGSGVSLHQPPSKTCQSQRVLARIFWFGSAVSFVAAVIRACLPESAVFLRAKAARKAAEEREGVKAGPSKTKVFIHETKQMLKTHWLLCIYAVLLMTGFKLPEPRRLSQPSSEIVELSRAASSLDMPLNTSVVVSQSSSASFLSVHLSHWILPDGFGKLAAGAFCVQFGVQGAWGVVPIFLAEMSPPAFRATFPGVAYQLGNMVSSASAQIEATGGDHLKTTVRGQVVPDYAKVQGIFLGVVSAYLIIVTIFGPEHHGSEFEKHKAAFEEGGGDDNAYVEEDVLGNTRAHGIEEGPREKNRDSRSTFEENTKPEVQQIEKA
ncbi:Sugar (and other) transporter [Ceratobasidium sp. AG-Ba]|nr:Sugar (and other) transporter [Ceratobasidium sp. AG-Ba]